MDGERPKQSGTGANQYRRRNLRKNRDMVPLKLLLGVNNQQDEGVIPDIRELVSLKNIWRRVVGDKISQFTTPYRINRKVLSVAVLDPAWHMELSYIKQDIISKLATEGIDVVDIRFPLSKVAKKTAPKIADLTPPLSRDEEAIVDRYSQTITDDKVRHSFMVAMSAFIKRNKRRK